MNAKLIILIIIIINYCIFASCLNVTQIDEYPFEGYFSWNSIQVDDATFVTLNGNMLNLISVDGINVNCISTLYTENYYEYLELYNDKIYCSTLTGGIDCYEINNNQFIQVESYTPSFQEFMFYSTSKIEISNGYAFVLYYDCIESVWNSELKIYNVEDEIELVREQSFTDDIIDIIIYNDSYSLISFEGLIRVGSIDNIESNEYQYHTLEGVLLSSIDLIQRDNSNLYTITKNEYSIHINSYNLADNYALLQSVETTIDFENYFSFDSCIIDGNLIVSYAGGNFVGAISIFNIENGITYDNTLFSNHMVKKIYKSQNEYFSFECNTVKRYNEDFLLVDTVIEYSPNRWMEYVLSDKYALFRKQFEDSYFLRDLQAGNNEQMPANSAYKLPRSNYEQNTIQFANNNVIKVYKLNEFNELEYVEIIPPETGYDYSIYDNKFLIRTSNYGYKLYRSVDTGYELLDLFEVDFDYNSPLFVDVNHFLILKNLYENDEIHYYKVNDNGNVELIDIYPISFPSVYVAENHLICPVNNGLILDITDRDNPEVAGNLDLNMLGDYCTVSYNGDGKYIFSGNSIQAITDENFQMIDWWYENTNAQFINESQIMVGRRSHLALLEVEEFVGNAEIEFPQPGICQLTNFPNPFNPSTTISFSTEHNEQEEQINIEVYNIKGQKIKTMMCHPELAEGRQSETTQSVTWDGTDSHSNPVASGVYLATLKAKDKILASRKMILLK